MANVNVNAKLTKHPRKLSADDVCEIVALRRGTNIGYRALGERFGVSGSAVASVCNGRTWNVVTGISKPPKYVAFGDGGPEECPDLAILDHMANSDRRVLIEVVMTGTHVVMTGTHGPGILLVTGAKQAKQAVQTLYEHGVIRAAHIDYEVYSFSRERIVSRCRLATTYSLEQMAAFVPRYCGEGYTLTEEGK